MCLVKTPKITPQASQEKPVQVFTNRYFMDRGSDAVVARSGRNSLKINRATPGSPSTSAPTPAPATPSPIVPPVIPVMPGGIGGGGGFDWRGLGNLQVR